MRRHIILTICCLIAITSCGTVRRVRHMQQTTVATASSATDSVRLRSTIEKMVRESMRSALATDLSKEVEVLHEVYTKPDSAGVTHLKERTVTSYKSNSQTTFSNVMTIDSTTHISESKDSISTERIISDTTETRTAESEKKSGTSALVRMLAWCGVLAVIMAILFVLRKIRLI